MHRLIHVRLAVLRRPLPHLFQHGYPRFEPASPIGRPAPRLSAVCPTFEAGCRSGAQGGQKRLMGLTKGEALPELG
jgi:hypothetical protein